jgi:hypothetical protein
MNLEAFAAKGNESSADVAKIFQSCRKLRKVDLGALCDRLTDELLQSVAAHCPLLQHLDLEDCSAVSDAAISKVAESCPLLQFVNIMRTSTTDAALVSLCKQCPLLKQIHLGGCHLTDAALLAVAEGLPGLTHIDFSSIEAITSRAVETLASKCHELELIGLSDCPNVSDVTLAKIAEHCSKLEELHVQGCDEVTVEIALKCSKLKLVYCSYGKSASMKQMFPLVNWT